MTTLAVVGSLNQDLVVRVPRLPGPGETVSGADVERHPGGKGANQAVAAARWGAEVRMFGAVGADPAGTDLLNALTAEGVATDGVATLDGVPTGTALIVVERSGENMITLAPGANRRFEAADPGSADVVLAQLEVPVEQITAVFGRVGSGGGARRVLNAAPAPVVDDGVRTLLAATDVLIVNETEASALASAHGSDQDRARALLVLGPALVVLTLGSAGAVAVTADAAWRQAGFVVDAVDSVGSGDAFCAVFAASLAEDAAAAPETAVPRALRRACAAGALTATRPGAQAAPGRDEVERFLRQDRP